jgi:hypothetical protein
VLLTFVNILALSMCLLIGGGEMNMIVKGDGGLGSFGGLIVSWRWCVWYVVGVCGVEER